MRSTLSVPSDLKSTLSEHGIHVGDLVFYITSKCNLRCAHCYVGTPLLDSATAYDASSVADTLKSFSPLERLTVLGGEPLLHPQLDGVIEAIAAVPCNEKRITTNLTVGNDSLFKRFRDAGVRLVVSLDGSLKDTHEAIRGPNTFDRTVRNIMSAVRTGVDLEVTHTVTSLSIGSILEFLYFVSSLGIRRVNFHSLSLVGNASSHRELAITPSQWRDVVKTFRSLRDEAGSLSVRYELGFASDSEVEALSSDSYHHHASSSFYAEGRQRIVIYPDQRIYISSEAFGTEAFIADLRSGHTEFNERGHSEWLQSAASDFSVTNLQPTRRGDASYPHALSVSYRECYLIELP